MKTPDQLAEEYATFGTEIVPDSIRKQMAIARDRTAFLAGYQAAKDQLADAGKVMNSPEKQDSCEHILNMEKMVDVNSLNNSNSWISVKERLPNLEKTSRSLRRESSCILLVSYGNVYVAHLCEDWTDRSHFIFEACTCNCRAFDMDIDEWKLDQVTHWMPLPKPPEDK